jgi:hypothetical protein
MNDLSLVINRLVKTPRLGLRKKEGHFLHGQFGGTELVVNTTQFFVRLWRVVPPNLLIY